MARLVLGPILRRITPTSVTVWVETDEACEVRVLDHVARTFHVEGHHYGLVQVTGLRPGVAVPYEVHLDDERCWPVDDGYPPPTIRPPAADDELIIALGSCQQRAPHHEPWTRRSVLGRRGLGPDALLGVAARMAAGGERPDVLVLIGDQVYADEPNPATVEALERRRGGPPAPGRPQISSFEEYTWLYQEAWQDGLMRWLLACVPSFMIFDDHDVIDDWNTSIAWRERIAREPWWDGRIHGALMAYWLYQHVGVAAFAERQDDELLAAIRDADDGGPILRDFARRADAGTAGGVGHRWSYAIDLGPCRLVVVDSRNARRFHDGRRDMLDEASWQWLEEVVRGDVPHLLVGTSVPWLLPRPLHDLESWNEAVADGSWGRRMATVGEWIRQIVDLEQWAAFGRSFERLGQLLGAVARGERGAPPETILVLSGDVHFGYVAEADLGPRTRVRQIVSSPLRQATSGMERRLQRLSMTPPLAFVTWLLALATPRRRRGVRWKVTDGPWFDNHVVVLHLRGRRAHLRTERACLADGCDDPLLEPLAARAL